MPTVTRDADYWADIRNGHVSPAPRPVQDALGTYLEFGDMGQWHGMIDNSKSRSRMERGRLAAAAGCDSKEMAITRNASASLRGAQGRSQNR